MKNFRFLTLIVLGGLLLGGCESTSPEETEPVYPMFVDNNTNGINDYVEQVTHDPGRRAGAASSKVWRNENSITDGEPGHSFTDSTGDGICDYAQDGGSTWHGPGFVDENNNGVCDYWDPSHPMHQRHEGMRFHDENDNHINDYFEEETHWGEVHDFHDENLDEICDYVQDGSPSWHGPGFIDGNDNGICDYWDESHPMHSQHEGMRFHDENENHVNDYFEEEMHWGEGHDFVDENGDGICDFAQDGSPTWHGPGFVDSNQNGMSDHWESRGRGHGGMMGGGHN